MSTIRLLEVIPSFGCGGAERMVVNLMTHLDQQRFEVAAISLAYAEGSVLEQRLAEENFQVWFLGKQPGLDLRIPHRLRNVVRQFRPDLIHSHLCLHYVFPSLIGDRSLGHVTTVHLPAQPNYRQVMQGVARMAYRWGVIPVAVSRDVAEWIRRVHGVADCMVIPNGIPVAEYQHSSTSRQIWRREHAFKEEDVLFVCVARLEKQKNHAMLVEAFARGFSESAPAHLLLVGNGGCRSSLEQQVRKLGLQGKIHFLGQRSDVPEVLGAADVFVLSSQDEGNPLSVMEAMAAGLPVVSTSVGGVPELIEDQRSGLLVQPGDCDGLAVAMLCLLHNREMRRTMAASAAQRAIRDFSALRMAQGYAELYERMVAGRVPVGEDRQTDKTVTHCVN